MIDISLTRAQFVLLVRILDREKTTLADAKNYVKGGADEGKYDKEYLDAVELLAAVLEEDADESM